MFASRLSTKLYDRIITDCKEMQNTYLELEGKHGWFFQKNIPSAAEVIDKAEMAEAEMERLIDSCTWFNR